MIVHMKMSRNNSKWYHIDVSVNHRCTINKDYIIQSTQIPRKNISRIAVSEKQHIANRVLTTKNINRLS